MKTNLKSEIEKELKKRGIKTLKELENKMKVLEILYSPQTPYYPPVKPWRVFSSYSKYDGTSFDGSNLKNKENY